MRIVGGQFRSRNILYPLNQKITRPTKDVVREGVFNALHFDIKGATVLDLFAGSGSMGLEALSRGAKFVYFIDNNQEAIRIIKQNIQKLDENNDSLVMNCDYTVAINKFINEKISFDIIILDPPYKLTVIDEIVETVLNNNILKEDGIIVIETDYAIQLEDKRFKQNKNYKYGRTLVTIRRK